MDFTKLQPETRGSQHPWQRCLLWVEPSVHHVTQADWSAKLMFPHDSLNLLRGTAGPAKPTHTHTDKHSHLCTHLNVLRTLCTHTYTNRHLTWWSQKVQPESTVACENKQRNMIYCSPHCKTNINKHRFMLARQSSTQTEFRLRRSFSTADCDP